MRARSRHQRGHTLIELMVAAFVFTVGALGLLRLTYGGAQGLQSSSRLTMATTLASARLNQLMTLDFDDTDLTAGAHVDGTKNLGPYGTAFTADGQVTADFGVADGWFARTWDVTDVGTNFKTITVSVSWTEPATAMARSVEMVGGKGNQ